MYVACSKRRTATSSRQYDAETRYCLNCVANECMVNDVHYLQCLSVSPWLPSVGAVRTCWACCAPLNCRGERVREAAEDRDST